MKDNICKDSLVKIGKRIVYLRTKFGFDQKTLAEDAQISLRTLQRIEGGEREALTGTFIAIAYVLRVHPAALLNVQLHPRFFDNPWPKDKCPFDVRDECNFVPNNTHPEMA